MIRLTIPILMLALAAPASAQQWQVAREQFAFAGRQLTVHVDVESEGTLRVIRGPAGLLRVSGRADGGMTAAGLTPDEHLTLTGSGPGPVEYVISVPDRGLGSTAAYTVFTATLAPRTVALPELTYVRSVTVRVEGSSFRIGASRPLALSPGNPEYLEIRPAGPPMEIIVVVPVGTGQFALQLGGSTALTLAADQLSVFCSPSTRQWLSGGRGWVTFTPTDGSLRCETQRIRHET